MNIVNLAYYRELKLAKQMPEENLVKLVNMKPLSFLNIECLLSSKIPLDKIIYEIELDEN